MRANNPTQLDQDSIICPISRQAIRHPIRIVHDKTPGYKGAYELESLMNHFNVNGYFCPMTRQPIKDVYYAKDLKQALDTFDNEGKLESRYDDYAATGLLTQLNKQFHPTRHALAYSLFTGLTMTTILIYLDLCFNNNENEMRHNSYYFALVAGIALAASDFYCRISNREQFGLINSLQGLPRYILDRIANDEPAQQNQVLNNANNWM